MADMMALIPLDGSKLSESTFDVLPLLKDLGFDRVRLVAVWENDWEDAAAGREDDLAAAGEKGQAYLEAYLREKADTVEAAGLAVETEVRVGQATEEILESSKDADLVAMATHGRSGITRWRLGSVADTVIQEA